MASKKPPLPPVTPAELERLQRQVNSERARRARTDPCIFAMHVMRDEETRKEIDLAPMHREWHRMIDKAQHRRIEVWASKESGKAVPLDTPIPTPDGWRIMGDLVVGDVVFGSDGLPRKVVGVSKIHHDRDLFRVTFDDGGVSLADADHQWIASTQSGFDKAPPATEHSGDGPLCACGCGLRVGRKDRSGVEWNTYVHNHHGRRRRWNVVTTREMLNGGLTRKTNAKRRDGSTYPFHHWRIPLASPVEYTPRDLPVHPYVLGVWLGDGDSTGATITCHEDDMEILRRCIDLEGGRCGKLHRDRRGNGKVLRQIVGGDNNKHTNHDHTRLRHRLRDMDLLGGGRESGVKHIPAEYLTASIEQRKELLAGLLDTDGTVTHDGKGSVEFSVTQERLARDTLELVRSLGFKASMTEGDAKLYGRVVSRRWRLKFSPRIPVFRLARKLTLQKLGEPFGRSRYRCIKRIEPVASVPVKCISVDSPDGSYLMGKDYTVTHNTSNIVARVLYELGRNPDLRVLVLSNTYQQSVKVVRTIARYIESSEALREVADGVTFHRLEPGTPWTDASITVKRPHKTIKEPSIQAVGVHGSFLGARFDLIIVDDILDYENTKTPRARNDVADWYAATVEGCLTQHARTICIGNAWHPDDIMHRWERTGLWDAKRFPVLDEAGQPTWPQRWSIERIEERRRILGPREFSRQMMCVASEDDDAHFTREMFALPLARGNGICPATRFDLPLPEGYRTYTGVDLAISQRSSADRTAIFTLLVNPVGEKMVLECQSGRWLAREIIDRIVDVHERLQSIISVETNAAQDYLRQVLQDRAPEMPVRSFTTGMNKHHPVFGIEAMAVELDRGLWVIPNMGGRLSGELNAWVSEMLSFDPTGHSGDRLVASWIARETARMDLRRQRPARVSVRLIGGGPSQPASVPSSFVVPHRW